VVWLDMRPPHQPPTAASSAMSITTIRVDQWLPSNGGGPQAEQSRRVVGGIQAFVGRNASYDDLWS